MTNKLPLFLLLLAVPSCIPKSYQKELAGPIPVLVTNQGSRPIGVFIGPNGSEGGPAKCGDEIAPGANATFKVKAGTYAIVMKGMNGIYVETFIGKTLDVAGPMSFVVADTAIEV